MSSLKANRKRNVENYQYRFAAIKRRLKVELKDPKECLDVLEKIVEKEKPVIKNVIWDTIDKRFHFLIQDMYLTDKKRYDKLMERYSMIIDRSDEANASLFEHEYHRPHGPHGIRPSKNRRFDSYSLKLALRGPER